MVLDVPPAHAVRPRPRTPVGVLGGADADRHGDGPVEERTAHAPQPRGAAQGHAQPSAGEPSKRGRGRAAADGDRGGLRARILNAPTAAVERIATSRAGPGRAGRQHQEADGRVPTSRNLITSAAKRAATTAAAAAFVLTATAGVSTAAPSENAAKTTTASSAVHLDTILNQWNHRTPDANTSSHAGRLYKGRNSFKCWKTGQSYTSPETSRVSTTWLRTDDDSGNANVYVSDTYLDDYGYTYDQDLLPKCTS
ncbi:hypothetical protein ACFYST_15335 [Kitasatospora sp. NPDC004614]|uniref:hypothetical protein n=1 Tax=unclassified Kitasatospora TaxID=2633591 RepID=UPI0036C83AA6